MLRLPVLTVTEDYNLVRAGVVFSKKKKHGYYILGLCGMHVLRHVCEGLKDNLGKSVLSFYHVYLGDQTQVIWLGSKCLCEALNCLTGC